MPELGVVGWILVIIALIFFAPFLATFGVILVVPIVAYLLFKFIFRFGR